MVSQVRMGSLGLNKPGGMTAPKIRPPRLVVTPKVGMSKGFGAGGNPSTVASPPAVSSNTQDVADQRFARGGRVGKPTLKTPAKGKTKGKK